MWCVDRRVVCVYEADANDHLQKGKHNKNHNREKKRKKKVNKQVSGRRIKAAVRCETQVCL